MGAILDTINPWNYPGNGITFPLHYYVDFVLRASSASGWNSGGPVAWANVTGYAGGGGGITVPFLEADWFEAGTDNAGDWGGGSEWTNLTNFGGCCGATHQAPLAGWHIDQYNNIGFRFTGDSSGNMKACAYTNGGWAAGFSSQSPPIPQCGSVFQFVCNTPNSSNNSQCAGYTGATQNNRTWIELTGAGYNNNNTPTQTNYTYVQRMTVWTCADWYAPGAAGQAINNDYNAPHQCFGTVDVPPQ